MTIHNHFLQPKNSIKNIREISLKAILSTIEIDKSLPKNCSKYQLVCTATDGYRGTLSCNGVLNSKSEKNILLLTDFRTDPAKAEKGKMAPMVDSDLATGRRFIKELNKISILKAN